MAAIIAVAVTTEGKREIVGLHIGPSEAEPFWSTFLRDLVRRGLKGVKLVVSDAHEGLKAAITRVVGATWQRCRVHFMRNALAHVPKGQNTMVAAAIRQVFLQPDHATATQTWRHVADQLRGRWPKLGACMDDAEHDVLAYMTFPQQHRVKLHSTDEIDKTVHMKMCYGSRARTTPWRRAEPRLQVPSGRHVTALPVWSVRAPSVVSPIGRRIAHRPARHGGRSPSPGRATL